MRDEPAFAIILAHHGRFPYFGVASQVQPMDEPARTPGSPCVVTIEAPSRYYIIIYCFGAINSRDAAQASSPCDQGRFDAQGQGIKSDAVVEHTDATRCSSSSN